MAEHNTLARIARERLARITKRRTGPCAVVMFYTVGMPKPVIPEDVLRRATTVFEMPNNGRDEHGFEPHYVVHEQEAS
jgi:hypothetical protein